MLIESRKELDLEAGYISQKTDRQDEVSSWMEGGEGESGRKARRSLGEGGGGAVFMKHDGPLGNGCRLELQASQLALRMGRPDFKATPM